MHTKEEIKETIYERKLSLQIILGSQTRAEFVFI